MEDNTAQTAPTTPSISLGSLIKKLDTPTAEVEFRNGIFFTLAYVPKARFREMYDSATEHVYDPKTKSRSPQLNGRKFFTSFIKSAVKGWRGATPASIATIANIDISTLTPAQRTQEIPFEETALLDLIEIAYELDKFIQDTSMDLNVFRPNHEDEVKN